MRRVEASLFGLAYALASLGCTIGPFLVNVVATFRTGSTVEGVTLRGRCRRHGLSLSPPCHSPLPSAGSVVAA
ncbi:hypothetical protein [Kribbella catacumbae]|uniref:hypothetical protein n=1 Tax=Kribbella catacumbae TaxID=460086 RepID=UPI0012FAB320|nr:hypothetical protein [Kribbella catacumbae]